MRQARYAVLLIGIIVITIVAYGSALADTELKFEKAAFFGDKGEQLANAIEVQDNRIYVAGHDARSGSKAFLAGYVPLADAPIWNYQWLDDKGSAPLTSAVFTGVAATKEGLYFVGYGLSDSKGKQKNKYSTSLLAKFPLDPSAGSKAGTPVWVARPEFFPAFRQEAFQAVTAVEEAGSVFIYAAGYASNGDNNSTAVLAKYGSDGRLVWSKMLSDTGNLQKSAGTALAALNGFIYVSGYSGSGTNKDLFASLPLSAKLWKYDASGQPIWEKEASPKLYPTESAMGAMKLNMAASGNHLYLVGSQKSTDGSGGDALLLKYNESGALIWESRRGTASESVSPWYGRAFGMAMGSDRFYVVGHTEDLVNVGAKKNEEAFLLEVDKEYGNILATHTYGDSKNNEAAFGVRTIGTNVYAVGLRRPQSGSDGDLMLLRYSALPAIEVKIDIQPDDSANMIIQDAEKRKVGVVLFATSELNLLAEVKHGSVTFGRIGNEANWESCSLKDMNQDGLVDYLCHFNTLWSASNTSWPMFRVGDVKGILKGQTNSGNRLMGTDTVRIEASAPAPVVIEPVPAQLTSAPSTSPTTLVSEPMPTSPEPTSTAPAETTTTIISTTEEPAPTTTSATTTFTEPTSELTSTTLTQEPILEPTLSTTSMTPTAVMEPTLITSTTSTSTEPISTSTTTVSSTSLQPYTTETTELSKTTLESQLAMTSTITNPTYVPPTTSTSVPPPQPTSVTSPTATRTIQDYVYRSGESRLDDMPAWLKPFISKRREVSDEETASERDSEANRLSEYMNLGKDAFYKGNFSEAVNNYQEALKLDPRSPELHRDLGLALFKQGNLEEAATHFSEALKLNPDDTSARQNLGIVLAKQKELQAAPKQPPAGEAPTAQAPGPAAN